MAPSVDVDMEDGEPQKPVDLQPPTKIIKKRKVIKSETYMEGKYLSKNS